MKKTSLTMLLTGLAMMSASAIADDEADFSTVTRVQYVNDCMQANTNLNVYEGVHKCSCVLDKLDQAFTQTEFEDISTAYMYRNLPADRGAQFRDNEHLSSGIKQYEKVSSSAYKECRIK